MSIVHLRMVELELEPELRKARGEGLKCVDVVKGMSEVVVDAQYLILAVVDASKGEVEVEVSGCLFVVIVMRIITHAEVEVEVRVDMVEGMSILSALLVWIGILLRSRNMLLLLPHLHPLQHQ
jgi:hypothetical protein